LFLRYGSGFVQQVVKPITYVLWDQYFTASQVAVLLWAAGFTVVESKTDIVQENDFTSKDVLFVRAGKT
jgi:hypothetical protein